MKQIGLKLAEFVSLLWRLIPGRIRDGFFTGMLVLESRHRDPSKGLTGLLKIRDRLDWVINERAMAYGRGEHPKHRLTRYHDFFVQHLANGQRVLDVGCGYGAVARTIACAYPASDVVGIDQDQGRLVMARASDNPGNLNFVEGDATAAVPTGPWDVVVLSNVLEHIDDRIGFLKALQGATSARRYLIRVPLFEREWQMALRRELGVDFRSDPDHKIEHTYGEFLAEIEASGLTAREVQTRWGEIWADCRREGDHA